MFDDYMSGVKMQTELCSAENMLEGQFRAWVKSGRHVSVPEYMVDLFYNNIAQLLTTRLVHHILRRA